MENTFKNLPTDPETPQGTCQGIKMETPQLEEPSKPTYQLSNNGNINRNTTTTETPQTPDILTYTITLLETYILPPKTRSFISNLATTHPILTTFLLAQLLCSGIPIALFLLGALIAASIAVAIYSIVALLVLGPVLMVTTFLGVCLWGWGWGGWVVGKWVIGVYFEGQGEKEYGNMGTVGTGTGDGEKKGGWVVEEEISEGV